MNDLSIHLIHPFCLKLIIILWEEIVIDRLWEEIEIDRKKSNKKDIY